jgi:putative aldouronate transport system substrate-binding protein
MKRALVLVLAVLMALSLFAGCKKENGTTTPTSTVTGNEETTTPETTEDPDSPYHFAAGKFEVDANGLPTGTYDYELPISTTDEVLTFWTAVYTPEWLPPDKTLGEMPGAVQFQEKTGVHVEYVVPPVAGMAENFSLLLAADDLCDITTHASAYYGGPFKNAVVDEEYFINIYDYKDYCPNFIYEIIRNPDDEDLIHTVFSEPTLITQFVELKDRGVLGGGFFTRGDWLEDWGLSAEDITTVDDIHNMLMLSKTDKGLEYPMFCTRLLNPSDLTISFALTRTSASTQRV